jgi:uncharacterized protein YmfQ (DUF2313 family)
MANDPSGDRHIRRSGDDYAQALLSLLPQGPAWSRDPGAVIVRTLWGLAQYWGFVDSRAADLLERESDPRQTIELLPDWETAWGLPDPCFPTATSIGERQRMLVLKMTQLGGQSREFFEQVAQWLGYSITYIREWAPFMVGVSQVGDTRDAQGNYRWEIGPPEMRFYWSVHISGLSLVWFRCGAGQCGVDPHVRIGHAPDLECLFNRWKPAHTQVIFDYSDYTTQPPPDGVPLPPLPGPFILDKSLLDGPDYLVAGLFVLDASWIGGVDVLG